MPDSPFETLRLILMQDVLPVGLAIFDRAKKGELSKITEVFTNSDDPVEELRNEGEPSATIIRERLDEISPGLGNPVMKVQVSVEDIDTKSEIDVDQPELTLTLERIDDRIELLNKYLDAS